MIEKFRRELVPLGSFSIGNSWRVRIVKPRISSRHMEPGVLNDIRRLLPPDTAPGKAVQFLGIGLIETCKRRVSGLHDWPPQILMCVKAQERVRVCAKTAQ